MGSGGRGSHPSGATRDTLTGWLGDPARLPGARITNLQTPEFTGFSSEILMVDVEHGGLTEPLAVRVAPLHYQVFPETRFAEQYRLMRILDSDTDPADAAHGLLRGAVRLQVHRDHVADRPGHDRVGFNAFPLTGDAMLIVGLGQYPNLGVTDAFALFRRGSVHRVLRTSRELGADRMNTQVGPFGIEVLEGLKRLRVVLSPNEFGLSFDLTWEVSIPAQVEPQHYIRWQERVIFDSKRLAQTGRWTGSIAVDGETLDVTPDRWWGTRDRSWGIRPVGESEPPGIQSRNAGTFYWLYTPATTYPSRRTRSACGAWWTRSAGSNTTGCAWSSWRWVSLGGRPPVRSRARAAACPGGGEPFEGALDDGFPVELGQGGEEMAR